MSEAQPAYRFTFYRPSEVWKDGWIECDGIGRVNYRLGMEFGPALLSKVIKLTGKPDGDITCDEVRTSRPLKHYFVSAYALADMAKADTSISVPVAKSLALIMAGNTNIDNMNDLIARGFVSDNQITETGKDALALHEAVNARAAPTVTLTVSQREAFGIVANSPDKWDDLHGKTQNLLINSGWVEMIGKVPSLTSTGLDIYQNIVTAPKNQTEATAPSEAVIKAIISLRDNPNLWSKVAPRMKGELKARGFVVIENKDYATITPEALQAITEFQLEETC